MFFGKSKLLRLQIEELQKKNDILEEEKEILKLKLKEIYTEMHSVLKEISILDIKETDND